MAQREESPRSSSFYGWTVLASSFLILFFTSGARYSLGVIFKPMIAEFGWDRGAISLAFFLNMTLFAFSLMAAGKLYDRYGLRWVIIVSSVFLSGGYILVSFVNAFWQFLLCYGIIAAIGLGGPSVTLMATVTSKWFDRWRGAAVSTALSGHSLGQFVLIPLFTVFVSRYGWRASYFTIGLIMLGVNMTLALWVIRGEPDDFGQKWFGDRDQERTPRQGGGVSSTEPPSDLTLREAMHTRSFWLFLIVMFICGSGDFLVSTHLIPFLTDHGVSSITAGNMFAWFGLMSLAGILAAGPVSDLIGNKIPIVFTFVLRFLLFLLILKYQNLGSFYGFALAFGFTVLITAPLTPTLIGRLYGFTHLGLMAGFITTVHHLGGGFWAYLGGVVFDQTGSYRLAFILSAIMAIVAVLCTLFIVERRHLPPSHRAEPS